MALYSISSSGGSNSCCFDIKKEKKTPVRYITVIYPVKKVVDYPKLQARFVGKYNAGSLKLEICVDGKRKCLEYSIN